METFKISKVSKELNISTRTLRYYEQIGLIESQRSDEYAYRTYTENTVLRLKQIILLKTLEISLKDIKEILENKNAHTAINAFESKLDEIEGDMNSLQVLSQALKELTALLKSNFPTKQLEVLNEKKVTKLLYSLQERKKKGGVKMDKLNRASEALKKQISPRIIYIAPCTVASICVVDFEPENKAQEVMDNFVRTSGLLEQKPDLRVFGFNNPSPTAPGQKYGYEFWVTVNKNTQVPEPLVKKEFAGGLYAAHAIDIGNFHEWEFLSQWVENNEDYEGRQNREDLFASMGGLMEEVLNYPGTLNKKGNRGKVQLDLLFPVREI